MVHIPEYQGELGRQSAHQECGVTSRRYLQNPRLLLHYDLSVVGVRVRRGERVSYASG